MENIELTIKKYRRMAVTGITSMHFTPRRKLQLVLGSNGSGKSSLMSELIPSLSDPNKHFFKGGSKTLAFDLDGRHFELGFTSEKGVKHFFRIDGVERNDGGTTTVQKDLLLRELGIDNNIHGLLIGKECITAMSTAKRREWFTRLSEVSYDYAIGLYCRLKEKLNHTVGAAKRTKARLVTEQSKLLSEEEQAYLEQRHSSLQRRMDELNSQRERVERNTATIHEEWTRLDAAMSDAAKVVIRMAGDLSVMNPIGSRDDIEVQRQSFSERIAGSRSALETLHRRHREDSKVLDTLRNAGAADAAMVEKMLLDTVAQISALVKKVPVPVDGSVTDFISAVKGVYEPLTALLLEIPDNRDRRYNKEDYEVAITERDAAYSNKQEIDRQISQVAGRIAHLEAHEKNGESTCPKCSHRWVPGYDPRSLQELRPKLEELRAKSAELEIVFLTNKEKVIIHEEYRSQYRQYVQLTRTAPALSGFWDSVMEEQLIQDYPQQVLARFTRIYSALDDYESLQRLKVEKERLAMLHGELQKASGVTLEAIEGTVRLQEEEITKLTQSINHDSRVLSHIESTQRRYARLEVERGELRKLKDRAERLDAEFLRTARNELIQRELELLMSEMTDITRSRNELSSRKAVIHDLEKEIEFLASEEKAAKLLVDELSPTKGLIAEGLLGFIRVFVRQMNAFIKNVWTYPLVIAECNVSEDTGADLDYKFPMLVGKQKNPVADVSLGSTGICEIIDLAFRIVAMRYLKMNKWPLILDEFGRSLDIKHREHAVYTIKQILESAAFNQVFMVSHYQDVYGALDNAEVLVVCSNNIVLPDVPYNQHAQIAY